MAGKWDDGWDDDSQVYSPDQVYEVLNYAGIEVVSTTETHFLCYCPVHGNTDTAAFAINKTTGLYCCFNPACGVAGSLEQLLRQQRGLNVFQAARVILKYKNESNDTFAAKFEKALLEEPVEFEEFPQATLDRLHNNLWNSRGYDYLINERGFEDTTLEYFQYGYSAVRDMVTVPMHDPTGKPIGFIGRSVEGKRFRNTDNLPKSKTMYNIHRAKKYDTAVVMEASFDVGLMHQSGFPNGVGLLGGYLSPHHVEQFNRYFSTIIIMTDVDDWQYYPNCRKCRLKGHDMCTGHKPGRVLGDSIAEQLGHKKILWASYQEGMRFPEGKKDPGKMTTEERIQCVKGAVSSYEFYSWNIDD